MSSERVSWFCIFVPLENICKDTYFYRFCQIYFTLFFHSLSENFIFQWFKLCNNFYIFSFLLRKYCLNNPHNEPNLMPKIATHTLGCKLNFAETSAIVRQFATAGYEVVDFHAVADVYVVNTCTVTATAEKKCRSAIRQAVARNPRAIVAVVGCFAQNDAAQIARIQGVTLILGNHDKHRLLQHVQAIASDTVACSKVNTEMPQPTDFDLSYSMGDRTRTFFKIQDGCDYFCTYCAIPFARGRSRSATIEETMKVAREIADGGAKEVVLTGVNTGTFGQHHREQFIDLLRQLDELPNIERYRISSIEPNLLTEEMIDFVAGSKHFAHHFHIPLQAGSDKVLKAMHRRYTTQFYADKLAYIKKVLPDCCLAADLMVGFRGEDEATFTESCHFIETLPISYLHVFPYSERPNTVALKMEGVVPVEERVRRSEVMHAVSERKKKQFYAAMAGTRQQVLWESDRKQDCMLGFTGNYLRVQRPFDSSRINSLEEVILSENFYDDVFDIIP